MRLSGTDLVKPAPQLRLVLIHNCLHSRVLGDVLCYFMLLPGRDLWAAPMWVHMDADLCQVSEVGSCTEGSTLLSMKSACNTQ
jgi:hypothetical protein